MDSKKCDEISKENGIPILVKLMNCSKNLLIRKQAAFILIDVIEKRQFCEFHRVKACDRLKIKDDKDGIPDNCKKIVETDAILLLLSKQLKCPKSPDWKLCKRILTLFETVSEEKIRKCKAFFFKLIYFSRKN
uniref:Uncharacterized protein n=1 Tax=Panagrolaimus superbus TaxID=310955 RepID=A0A914Y054_9BILA